MTYATMKTDLAKASEIKDFLHATEIDDEKHPYDYFDTNYEGVHIHANKSKKEVYVITFSGEEEKVKEVASYFSSELTMKSYDEKTPRNISSSWEDLSDQIGSDEVGKGDFFGPLVVVASFVSSQDIPYLERLHIDDSKKMNDDYILDIGANLKRRIKNYAVMISANKLSSLNENGFNIDKVLSLTHNLAHKGLIKKYGLSNNTLIYIDQFLSEKNYRRYLQDDIVSNPLYFRTKGETYYPSVAASSVIARYTFLKEWKTMEDHFHTTIPKGASSLVDTVYGRLKNLYGEEALLPYIKRFFNNYKKTL